MAYTSGGGAIAADTIPYYQGRYSARGGFSIFLGFDVNGVGDNSGDPLVEDMLVKADRELDQDRRKAIIFDLQRYLAKPQYGINSVGQSSSFTLAWPALKNLYVYQSAYLPEEEYHTLWLDETLAPVKKS